MPKTFSVITINYNNLAGLQRSFESVSKQSSRSDIEYIVIDGGSTDGSADFLQNNKAEIDVLVMEKDGGIYDAMNKGLNASTGKYVWFINSGDAIYANNTAEELLLLAKKDSDIIFGDTMFINNKGEEIGLISKLKPQILPLHLHPKSFQFGMSVCHQSFIVKRTICPPYNLQYRQAADIDWILNILKKHPRNVRAQGIVSRFELGGSSYQNEKKAWKERYQVLSVHYGTFQNFIAHLWIAMRRVLFNCGIWRPGK